MKLNKSLFKFELTYDISDDRVYRKHHRINIYCVDYTFNLLISRRYKAITIHIYFENGIYIKYPKTAKTHKDLNANVNKCVEYVRQTVIPQFEKHTNIKLPLGMFYLVLDKIASECQFNRKKLRLILARVLDNFRANNFFLLSCLGLLLQNKYKISKEDESLLSKFTDYVMNFPSVLSYKPQLDLPNFKFSKTNHPNTVLLTYEEFLETIEVYTDDEVLELIGNYKILNPDDYTKDLRRMLYLKTQRFTEKPQH